jgi:hypothetical protein
VRVTVIADQRAWRQCDLANAQRVALKLRHLSLKRKYAGRSDGNTLGLTPWGPPIDLAS